jgi:hypothetical protein
MTAFQASEYAELAAPLLSCGQYHLAGEVASIAKHWEQYNAWINEEDFKGILKRLSRRYFGHPTRPANDSFRIRQS